jgi:hypothetical protein
MGEARLGAGSNQEDLRRQGDEAERAIARAFAIGLPVCTVVGALAAGIVGSVGSALLVLASGTLLATIALLWASLRTLTGEAPLPSDVDPFASRRPDVDELGERKRRVLRALKDLQTEHDLGKIDDDDYDTIAARYREDAKTVMKEMDHQAAPARAEAERLAAEFLLRRRSTVGSRTREATPSARPTREANRIPCSGCGVSNEPDAAFCKSCGTALTGATGEDDAGR